MWRWRDYTPTEGDGDNQTLIYGEGSNLITVKLCHGGGFVLQNKYSNVEGEVEYFDKVDSVMLTKEGLETLVDRTKSCMPHKLYFKDPNVERHGGYRVIGRDKDVYDLIALKNESGIVEDFEDEEASDSYYIAESDYEMSDKDDEDFRKYVDDRIDSTPWCSFRQQADTKHAEDVKGSNGSEANDSDEDYGSCDDLLSENEYDDEESERPVKKDKVFNPATDKKNPKFELYQKFGTKWILLDALRRHGIVDRRIIDFKKNDKLFVHGKCRHCNWEVYGVKIEGENENTFQIRTVNTKHSCGRVWSTKNVNSNIISDWYVPDFADDPNISDLIPAVNDALGNVSHRGTFKPPYFRVLPGRPKSSRNKLPVDVPLKTNKWGSLKASRKVGPGKHKCGYCRGSHSKKTCPDLKEAKAAGIKLSTIPPKALNEASLNLSRTNRIEQPQPVVSECAACDSTTHTVETCPILKETTQIEEEYLFSSQNGDNGQMEKEISTPNAPPESQAGDDVDYDNTPYFIKCDYCPQFGHTKEDCPEYETRKIQKLFCHVVLKPVNVESNMAKQLQNLKEPDGQIHWGSKKASDYVAEQTANAVARGNELYATYGFKLLSSSADSMFTSGSNQFKIDADLTSNLVALTNDLHAIYKDLGMICWLCYPSVSLFYTHDLSAQALCENLAKEYGTSNSHTHYRMRQERIAILQEKKVPGDPELHVENSIFMVKSQSQAMVSSSGNQGKVSSPDNPSSDNGTSDNLALLARSQGQFRRKKPVVMTRFCTHCQRNGHEIATCFKINGLLEWLQERKNAQKGIKPQTTRNFAHVAATETPLFVAESSIYDLNVMAIQFNKLQQEFSKVLKGKGPADSAPQFVNFASSDFAGSSVKP
ncbi:OLC1v1000760C1 [Oldenlandia corymbosa var. corymbosa]|uniref:OLC1v1000760C1 n=1 Tax=Oldenlandia corymbosa var. corymbosa TaxID=529605 RepID=A0AAV1D5W8_OLDCO|nr:OLC1v1000760C1 [Oldenlandia corymbosa var. corymbosa]